MIKVVHLSTFHLEGGAATAATRLHRALLKTGVESNFLSARKSAEEIAVAGLDDHFSGRNKFWLRFVGERLSFLPFEKNPGLRFSFSPATTGFDLSWHPLVRGADILHFHWVNFGFLSLKDIGSLLRTGKPAVWTLHDMWPFTGGCHYSGECRNFIDACGNCKFLINPGEKDLSARRLGVKKHLWTFSPNFRAVACSEWLGREAKTSALFKQTDVVSIPNAIDTSVFRPVDRAIACKQLNLPTDRTYILFAAAKLTSLFKGFNYLMEALKSLQRDLNSDHAPVELLVLGGGDQELLEGISFPTRFLGFIKGDESLNRIYNAASVYITPSIEDNLPNTVMEALSCGTPVVGFRTGGIPEMVDHLVNGFIADYKSSTSLAEGIRWVLQADQEGKISDAAREKVLKNYDELIVAQRYMDIYQQLTGTSSKQE